MAFGNPIKYVVLDPQSEEEYDEAILSVNE
jgi:hypothetical protein